ncbi:MAG TPA: RNA polymerase sigma factor [Candidatus Paceibacterota bacterium]|nr:RNA polymerase sigma factor [Candidatus Paceibacterota bacterium]
MNIDINNTFKSIYENESDAIFRFCLVRVSDREQALDITQETFLRLWKNLFEGKEVKNGRAFVFTIANHLIIDWYRKKKSIPFNNMKDTNEDGEEVDYDPKDSLTTDENILLGAEGRYLIEKMNELSPMYRDPIYLRFVEDLSPGEIGDILGISTNAASVRINRGLIELRKKSGYSNNKSE